MANINTVTVVGNITRDPEVKQTKSGKDVVELGVAVNRSRPDGNGGWTEDTSFVDVTVWEQQALNVAASCPKGTRVLVVGRFQQDRWETDEGDKRSKHRLIADVVAPSLEWATAEVTRNPKKGGDGAPSVVDEDF